MLGMHCTIGAGAPVRASSGQVRDSYWRQGLTTRPTPAQCDAGGRASDAAAPRFSSDGKPANCRHESNQMVGMAAVVRPGSGVGLTDANHGTHYPVLVVIL